MLDLEKLTLGEIATVEGISGMPLASLSEGDKPQGLMLAGLAMIAKRRDGFPAFKLGDAKALTMDEALEILGWDDDAAGDDADGDDDDDTAEAEEPTEDPAPPAPKAGKSRAKR